MIIRTPARHTKHGTRDSKLPALKSAEPRNLGFEIAAFLGILLVAIFVSWVFARIAVPLPRPDNIPAPIAVFWAYDPSYFYDDSYEFSAFFFFFLAFFIIIILGSILLTKVPNSLAIKLSPVLELGLLIILLAGVTLAGLRASPHMRQLAVGPLFSWPWFFVTIVVLITLFHWREFYAAPKWYYRLVDCLVGVAVIWTGTWSVYSAWGRQGDAWNFTWHIAPIFNPIYEISQGRTLGVDLNTLYGFYGYFFVPIQRLLFGNVTVYGTILIMSFLVGVCNFAIYAVLRHLVPLPWAVVGLFATIWSSRRMFSTWAFFSAVPVRALMPSIMIVSLVIYHYNQNRENTTRAQKIGLIALPLVSLAVAVIWSPEAAIINFGMASSYFAFLAYHRSMNWKYGIVKILISLILTSIVALSGTAALQLITFVRSRQFISIRSYFWGIQAFAGEGLLMLPLDEQQPWTLLLFIYAFSLTYCIYILFAKKSRIVDDSHLPIIFTLAVTGLAVFGNFLGRSGLWTLAQVSWPGWILVTYFLFKTQHALNSHSQLNGSAVKWPLLGVNAVFSFVLAATAVAFFNIPRTDIWKAWRYNQALSTTGLSDFLLESQKIIQESGVSSENIAVIDHFAPLYLAELDIQNQFIGPAVIDSFFRSDFDNMITFVEQHDGPLFIGRILAVDPAIPTISDDFTQDFQLRLNQALTENFHLIKDTNEYGFGTHLAFYLPRTD